MDRILFVDDDEMTLKLIERKLKATGIKCHFANSGEEALKWVKQFDIDVMVTDIMMPDMNGLELSKKVKEISPGTLRMILSGNVHSQAIVEAINEGHVYKYLVKPWKIDQEAIHMLKETVKLSKSWKEEDQEADKLHFIELSALRVLHQMQSWMITDDNMRVLEKSSDFDLPLNWRDKSYDLINGAFGTMRLYDFSNEA